MLSSALSCVRRARRERLRWQRALRRPMPSRGRALRRSPSAAPRPGR